MYLQERLAKLEALLASKKGSPTSIQLKFTFIFNIKLVAYSDIMLGVVDTESSASTIKELQSKLETAQSELQSEREKVWFLCTSDL